MLQSLKGTRAGQFRQASSHAHRTYPLTHAPGRCTALHGSRVEPVEPFDVEVISWKSNQQLAEVCTETITQALVNDPSTSYYCKNGEAFYEAVVKLILQCYPHSPQLVSVNKGSCAAICYAIPRLERIHWPALVWNVGLVFQLLSSLKLSVILQGLGESDFYEGARQRFLQEHGGCALYLLVIGTQPGMQSQGLGGAALKALSAVADRQQVPIYLEATSARSASFYARHGFKEISTKTTRPGAPPITFMYRPPSETAAASMPVIANQGSSTQLNNSNYIASLDDRGDQPYMTTSSMSEDSFTENESKVTHGQNDSQKPAAVPVRGLFSQHPFGRYNKRSSPG